MAFNREVVELILKNAQAVLSNPRSSGEMKARAMVARDHAEVALGLDGAIQRAKVARGEQPDPVFDLKNLIPPWNNGKPPSREP